MNWLKSFANTPFSDLWLPSILIGLAIITLLLVHHVWLSWRLRALNNQQLAKSARSGDLNQPFDSGFVHERQTLDVEASAQQLQWPVSGGSSYGEHHVGGGGADRVRTNHDKVLQALNLDALTAQRHPIQIEDLPASPPEEGAYQPSHSDSSGNRIEPDFQTHTTSNPSSFREDIPAWMQATTPNAMPRSFESNTNLHTSNTDKVTENVTDKDTDKDTDTIFFNPHQQTVVSKAVVQENPHPVLHFQCRLRWSDAQGKKVLPELLKAYPWAGELPVATMQDHSDANNVVLAWQVVNRRVLASAQEFEQFNTWCQTLASAGGARCELLTNIDWDAFLDQAHGLLLSLDSVIVLKLAVPLVQFDLFNQAMLAARFVQQQEHWVFREHADSPPIVLERLWQQGVNPQAFSSQDVQVTQGDTNPQALFQLMIDIPHLDSLEARKVYMRVRSVARSSAAIIQSAQGVHLSEGMLDRYGRELISKQHLLSEAGVEPGSALAQRVYKPRLSVEKDLQV